MRPSRQASDAPSRRGGSVALHTTAAIAVAVVASLGFACCSSVSFERETESSGTFSASGWSFTLFSVDLPKSALNIARENASDANLPNTVVSDVTVGPYLGALDFLLEFVGVRYARVEGTWGFSGNEARDRDEFGDD